jgi:hypothetical protein
VSGGIFVDDSLLRDASFASRTYAMRRNWMTILERQYVQTLLVEATQHDKMRDMKACVAFVQHTIKSRRMSASRLSPDVINKFAKKDGFCLLQQMFNRHAGYKNLPCPLRGKALASKAVTEGVVARSRIVKVDTEILREELNMAEGRRKMKMTEDIGRRCNQVLMLKTKRLKCNQVLMLKTKRLKCVQAIKAEAIVTGAADITRVWREFQSSTKTMAEVSLEAIAAVARLNNVYVLDIHKMTCLFHITMFKQVMELPTDSHIFAIYMGEDVDIFDENHFHLLAGKLRDGSSPVRRWFCESNRTRRAIWVECGLVRDNAHLKNPMCLQSHVVRTVSYGRKAKETKPDLHGYSRLNLPSPWQRSTKQPCRIRLAIG